MVIFLYSIVAEDAEFNFKGISTLYFGFRDSKLDIESGEEYGIPRQSRIQTTLQKVKPGPKTVSRGKLVVDWTTNMVLPAVDEITDIVSAILYFL